MRDKILLNDLSRIHRPIRNELNRAIARVLNSNWFLRGREVDAFEEEWADFCGQKYGVVCNSGTDALTLAALAMGISEASVQSNTLALTAIGLHRGGVDVRSSTLTKTAEFSRTRKIPFLYCSLAVNCPSRSVPPSIRRSPRSWLATTQTCHRLLEFLSNQNARCPGR